MTLSTLWSTSTHALAFALRVVDHFTGEPVPDVLEVRLDGRPELPVPSPSSSRRQHDGTYRFVDLPAGNHQVVVTDPSGRWSIAGSPLTVALPLADPTAVQQLVARPTPVHPDPAGRTYIRVRTVRDGTTDPVPGVQVAIASAGGPFARHAVSDVDGEAAHPVLGAIAPAPAGTVELEVEVDGGARPVLRTAVGGAAATAGTTFHARPGRATRVVIEVGP